VKVSSGATDTDAALVREEVRHCLKIFHPLKKELAGEGSKVKETVFILQKDTFNKTLATKTMPSRMLCFPNIEHNHCLLCGWHIFSNPSFLYSF